VKFKCVSTASKQREIPLKKRVNCACCFTKLKFIEERSPFAAAKFSCVHLLCGNLPVVVEFKI